ncbi:MAG: IS66 family transposase zinc-finger binding domain-containing protein [Methylotetracoccus sp.]
MSDAVIPIPRTTPAEALAEVLPDPLPDDPAALKALLQAQQAAFLRQLAAERAAAEQAFAAERAAAEQAYQAQRAAAEKAYHARLLELYEQIRLARQRQFGRRSEAHPDQLGVFDEAEVTAVPAASDIVELPPPATASSTTRRRGKRHPLPAELPRIDVLHDVPETERICACGTPLVEIGEEISEQLDIIPMQVRVLRHIRKRYGCPQRHMAPGDGTVHALRRYSEDGCSATEHTSAVHPVRHKHPGFPG